MSQNGQALTIVALPMPPGTIFATHVHQVDQIIWSPTGVTEVTVDATLWVLPPTRALWMPAGTAHETRGRDATRMLRGALLPRADDLPSWRSPRALEVSPLLAALLDHLGDQLTAAARARAEAVIPDLLTPVDAIAVEIRMPHDDRGLTIARSLIADPSDGRPLAAWGSAVGASPRTLSRIFIAETGMTFSAWRSTVRVRAALQRLAAGTPVAHVADLVGYATPSAFVAAFRRVTGSTPGAYVTRVS